MSSAAEDATYLASSAFAGSQMADPDDVLTRKAVSPLSKISIRWLSS